MLQRTLFLPVLLLLLLGPALHQPVSPKDPWAELEKGLRLCDVEISIYESCCYINEQERERIGPALAAPAVAALEERFPCGWSLRGGYEKGEHLFRVYGTERSACSRLWQIAGIAGSSGAENRVWSVEGYSGSSDDPVILGKKLIGTLGGHLQQVSTYPRMVQMLAYLPWAGEGFMLERQPINLALELSEDSYREKIRIRLGIPVLLSPAKINEEGTATWIDS